ncbi:hypothetical protein PLICRDRAFT_698520 [Plicaturopsis crispa FD-325 SS-3]|nr:hypothetical protein PLICRDRAFT_698520 [Plicaturopsis crispa FD-325 SS-3]
MAVDTFAALALSFYTTLFPKLRLTPGQSPPSDTVLCITLLYPTMLSGLFTRLYNHLFGSRRREDVAADLSASSTKENIRDVTVQVPHVHILLLRALSALPSDPSLYATLRRLANATTRVDSIVDYLPALEVWVPALGTVATRLGFQFCLTSCSPLFLWDSEVLNPKERSKGTVARNLLGFPKGPLAHPVSPLPWYDARLGGWRSASTPALEPILLRHSNDKTKSVPAQKAPAPLSILTPVFSRNRGTQSPVQLSSPLDVRSTGSITIWTGNNCDELAEINSHGSLSNGIPEHLDEDFDEDQDSSDDGFDDVSPYSEIADTVTHDGITYTFAGIIGEGGYGRVFHARSSLGENVAVKVLHKPKMYASDIEGSWTSTFGATSPSVNYLKTEIDVLKLVTESGGPFLTRLLCSFQDERNVYLVMNMYSEDLVHRIRSFADEPVRPRLPFEDIKLYAAELLLGIEELHSLKIVHRDMKPDNVLIAPNGHIAIADFGLSKSFHGTPGKLEMYVMDEYCGTEGYLAPEVDGHTEYDASVDLYGWAYIVLDMYVGGGQTFSEVEPKVRTRAMLLNKITKLVGVHDKAAEGLLFAILLPGRQGRLGIEGIKRHPYWGPDWDWSKVASRELEPTYKPTHLVPKNLNTSVKFSTFHCPDEHTDMVAVKDEDITFSCHPDLRQDATHGDVVVLPPAA